MDIQIDDETWDNFVDWLKNHEYEIESGENDFVDLRQLFWVINGRNAGEK